MNAYLEGRTLIHNQAALTEIQAQRTIIVNTWEKLVAASVIGYVNSVISKIAPESTASVYHSWAEMRAFAMALQYNSYMQISMSDLTAIITDMGNAPPVTSDYANYTTILEGIKIKLQTAYSFSEVNMAAW